jgi:hypothetical protein
MLHENQESTPRSFLWIETRNFVGWRCSECDWMFRPTGPPVGGSLDEMKHNFLKQLSIEFASHTCANDTGVRARRLRSRRQRMSD